MDKFFIRKDREESQKRIKLIKKMKEIANEEFEAGRFHVAAVYHENIARILNELAQKKQLNDNIDNEVKHLEETLYKKQLNDNLNKRKEVRT